MDVVDVVLVVVQAVQMDVVLAVAQDVIEDAQAAVPDSVMGHVLVLQ